MLVTILSIPSSAKATETTDKEVEEDGASDNNESDKMDAMDIDKYKDTDLYLNAIENNRKQGYRVHEITRDDICVQYSNSSTIYFPKSKKVTVPAELGEVQLIEMLVEKGQMVKKGTPIAKVKTQIDEITLKQQTLELERARSDYNSYISSQSKVLREQKKAISDVADKYDKKAAQLEYQIAELNYQIEKNDQYTHIKELDEQIQINNKIKNTSEILATMDGMILSVTTSGAGEKVNSTTVMAEIVDTSYVYFTLRDTGRSTSYSMNVSFEATKREDNSVKEFTGKVVACVPRYNDNSGEYTQVYMKPDKKINYDDIKDRLLETHIDIIKLDNVPVIPIECTYGTEEGLEELLGAPMGYYEVDGDTLIKRFFTPGLSDDRYYQIATGLEEGTKVLVK